MLSTTLTTLAAAAALHAQTIAADAPAAAKTVSAPVTAIAQPAKTDDRRGARIPGTFTVTNDQDWLEGVHALYVVRTGDGA
jgi:hypothetical protein